MIQFLNNISRNFLKRERGVTEEDIHSLAQREKFSKLLPYQAYDDENQTYYTIDDKLSFIFECLPLTYGSAKANDSLATIIETVPFGTVIQAILYADDNIEPILKQYEDLRKDTPEKFRVISKRAADLYRDAAKNGFKDISGISARTFRLFFCVKLPGSMIKFDSQVEYLRNLTYESLKGAYLAPRYFLPQDLCSVLQRIFNDKADLPPSDWKYNEDLPINKQILMGGTKTEFKFNRVELGSEKFVSIQTVKDYPEQIGDLSINEVLGGIFGLNDDANQLNFPFWMSTNIVVEDLKSYFHTKTNASMIQEKKGSTAKHKMTKEQELQWAAAQADAGVRFVRVIPSIMTFARSKRQLTNNVSKVQGLFAKKGKGFVLNNDKGILSALFLMSLPLGLYPTKKNIEWLERDRIMPAVSAARLLPNQADFTGYGMPLTLLKGRKGQIAAVDLFDKGLPSQNGVIAASTGSGKSYFCNRLLLDLRSVGAVLRVIDLGKSYKKLCRLLDGNFLEFTPYTNICLNPYTNIKNINEDLPHLTDTINQMIWSSTGQQPTETQVSLLKSAIRRVWNDYGNDVLDPVDKIKLALLDVKNLQAQNGAQGSSNFLNNIESIGAELAFNLEEFTTRGAYGKWFHGKATLDLEQDDFVVLELDELYKHRELFNVVVMQIINYMSDNLYLSDRDNRSRIHLFDEAWMWASSSSFVGKSIIRGYRTARKYKGSILTVYQSLFDLDSYGDQKEVLKENSAWTFLLRGENYDVRQEELLNLSEFEGKVLRSMQLVKGRYSELFVKNPFNRGVLRLPNDKFTHLVCSSDPTDNAIIENVAKEHGISELEAIEILAEQ